MAESDSTPPPLTAIISEETACLERIQARLEEAQRPRPAEEGPDYDSQLISLRDQIAQARLEDVPPLVEQMERVALLASMHRNRAEQGYVDPRSPYFGRLVLEEGERQREVLIGRATYLDTRHGVRIVDWRDAPVSRLYYRYHEGEDYVETFGEREVEGEIRTRRSLTINERKLKRITCPQGSLVRRKGEWLAVGDQAHLKGGQGAALRAEQHHRPGKLGVGGADEREDKHLKEITALIDPRQFELITHRDSGIVVIQGGAGSGKTTIGLHRLAYLAFQDPRRFRPDRMLVVVFNDALARYISRVLPALGVHGVPVRTYEEWASRLRKTHVHGLKANYSDDTPGDVTRLKKHPAMLVAIDRWISHLADKLTDQLTEALGKLGEDKGGLQIIRRWEKSESRPLAHRLYGLRAALGDAGGALPNSVRRKIDRIVRTGIAATLDVGAAWADVLTDRALIRMAMDEATAPTLSEQELGRALRWCGDQVRRFVDQLEEAEEAAEEKGEEGKGVDGALLEDPITLDREDDTLMLRIVQRMQGPLRKGRSKEPLIYEHILADEAQDLSPVELAVVIDTASNSRSITLAGDVAQRLHMDNSFTGWNEVLGELGLSHVEVEPLRLAYRSTRQIVDFARDVLGPLADPDAPEASRDGAPVELFRFSHSGDAVGFLAEELRDLLRQEPSASVAVIARYPELADLYYAGLLGAEVPRLRRIAEQDFPFKPGIDVTDVRQVKGLEFDYVVLLETTSAVYPADEESRHLLHIAATRAAHQVWLICSSMPSVLLPDELREREF